MRLGAFAFLVLAGCAFPVAEPLDLPSGIEAALPADIDRTEVNRDPDGCYFYVYAGDLFTVNDANGEPICVPDGAT